MKPRHDEATIGPVGADQPAGRLPLPTSFCVENEGISEGSAPCPSARQGRQVAHVSTLAADGSATEGPARDPTAAAIGHDARLRVPRRSCPHTLRDLQDRASPHPPSGRPPSADRPPHQSARFPTHSGRPSVGSRSRRQRDPELARPRSSRYDQPVRRDHDSRQARGGATVRARRNRCGFTPPKFHLAQRPGTVVLARFAVNRYVAARARSAHQNGYFGEREHGFR